MKKVVFLSTMAFDANVSIIKRLKEKYDLYTLFLCNTSLNSLGDIKIDRYIQSVNEIAEFKPLNSFIDLNKCYLVQHYSPKSINRYLVALKVYKKISKINPDTIITDAPTFQYFLSRFLFRKKTIEIVHDPFPHSGENTFNLSFYNRIRRYITQKFILLNEEQKNDFIKFHKINSKNVFTSFLSIYEFYSLFKTNNSIEENNKFKILFFGRISKYKGIEYLLEASKILLDREQHNIQVTIAGKGDFHFDINPYKKYKDIKFLQKHLDTGEMVQLITNSDIIICPYTDATQSGVIMTSYALDKPVIATNVGGLPEMLDYGKTGYLIPAKNTEKIVEAINNILKNKSILENYIVNMHNIYHKGNKSWDVAVDKIVKCIESKA